MPVGGRWGWQSQSGQLGEAFSHPIATLDPTRTPSVPLPLLWMMGAASSPNLPPRCGWLPARTPRTSDGRRAACTHAQERRLCCLAAAILAALALASVAPPPDFVVERMATVGSAAAIADKSAHLTALAFLPSPYDQQVIIAAKVCAGKRPDGVPRRALHPAQLGICTRAPGAGCRCSRAPEAVL